MIGKGEPHQRDRRHEHEPGEAVGRREITLLSQDSNGPTIKQLDVAARHADVVVGLKRRYDQVQKQV